MRDWDNQYDSEDNADREDEDWPDDEEDDGTRTTQCPKCGREVYEDLEQCPQCGEWIEGATSISNAWEGRPNWWIVLGLLGVGATLIAMLGI